jgi:hypothetical protein
MNNKEIYMTTNCKYCEEPLHSDNQEIDRQLHVLCAWIVDRESGLLPPAMEKEKQRQAIFVVAKRSIKKCGTYTNDEEIWKCVDEVMEQVEARKIAKQFDKSIKDLK